MNRRRAVKARAKMMIKAKDDGGAGRRSIKTIPEAEREEEEEEEEEGLDLPVSRGKEVLRPLSAPTNGSRGGAGGGGRGG